MTTVTIHISKYVNRTNKPLLLFNKWLEKAHPISNWMYTFVENKLFWEWAECIREHSTWINFWWVQVQKIGDHVERLLTEALQKAENLWASTGITTVKLNEILYRNVLKVNINNYIDTLNELFVLFTIVFSLVSQVGLLHLMALYGLLYIPHMKWETAAWCKYLISLVNDLFDHYYYYYYSIF